MRPRVCSAVMAEIQLGRSRESCHAQSLPQDKILTGFIPPTHTFIPIVLARNAGFAFSRAYAEKKCLDTFRTYFRALLLPLCFPTPLPTSREHAAFSRRGFSDLKSSSLSSSTLSRFRYLQLALLSGDATNHASWRRQHRALGLLPSGHEYCHPLPSRPTGFQRCSHHQNTRSRHQCT